jgi:tetratricopeptide (TPR) repeat protein
MKNISLYGSLLSLLLIPPVLAQEVHRISASGEIPVSAATQLSDGLTDQGDAMLSAGDYQTAEQTFRRALAVAEPGNLGWNPSAERGLAEALAAQGKTGAALRIYRPLVYRYDMSRCSSVAQEMRTMMRFAVLLSQTGQWAEAVSVYEKAIPKANFGDAPKLDAHFNSQVPMPIQLEALAHVAVGLELSGNDNKAAFIEFDKGRNLAPDAALISYYYGQGWQRLDPKDRAALGSLQQARAALQKAVKFGKGDVKKAAQKALRVAINTKLVVVY